jgi:hypothetical protein
MTHAFFLNGMAARRTCDLLYALHLLNLYVSQYNQHAESYVSATPVLLRFFPRPFPPRTTRDSRPVLQLPRMLLPHAPPSACSSGPSWLCTHTTQVETESRQPSPVTHHPKHFLVFCCCKLGLLRPPLSVLTSPVRCLFVDISSKCLNYRVCALTEVD